MSGGGVFADPRYFAEWSDERAFRRSFWTPTFKQLGIRYRRPYNMRHSYATAMLMAGMTPAFCAKQLGHSIEMFLRTYARWMDGAQNEVEMARLERSFSAKLPHAWPTAVAGGSQAIDLKKESSGVADGTRRRIGYWRGVTYVDESRTYLTLIDVEKHESVQKSVHGSPSWTLIQPRQILKRDPRNLVF